jgi:hypothetical protein
MEARRVLRDRMARPWPHWSPPAAQPWYQRWRHQLKHARGAVVAGSATRRRQSPERPDRRRRMPLLPGLPASPARASARSRAPLDRRGYERFALAGGGMADRAVGQRGMSPGRLVYWPEGSRLRAEQWLLASDQSGRVYGGRCKLLSSAVRSQRQPAAPRAGRRYATDSAVSRCTTLVYTQNDT